MAGLNPEQKAAATAPPGAVLVLAGAGSGKTRVLVTRIVHLLAGGAGPDQLVALTFSNRAAREMQARLKAYAGKAAPRRLGGHLPLPRLPPGPRISPKPSGWRPSPGSWTCIRACPCSWPRPPSTGPRTRSST